jgi:ankyrin repeat protein
MAPLMLCYRVLPVALAWSILTTGAALAGQEPPRARNPALEKILAEERGETPEVAALLQGSDPNARDKARQRTALTWSIIRNDQAAFDRFIAAPGVDVNAKDSAGETPLLFVAQLAMQDDLAPMAEALVAKGADVVGDPPGRGLTPLMHAANSNAPGVAQAILSKLPAKDLDVRNSLGSSALEIAASVGAVDVIELLLEKGAKLDTRDRQGKTPLILAASHTFPGTVATVKLLLSKKVDPNVRDTKGNTALSEAKEYGSPEVVELLLAAGAK